MSETFHPTHYPWLPESHEAMIRLGEVSSPQSPDGNDEDQPTMFEQLDEEERESWHQLIDKKITFEAGGENHEQREQAIRLLERIVGYGNLSQEFFSNLVSQIIIMKENHQAANGNEYIGAAVVKHGGLMLFPRFFEGDEETLRFDQEHVLAHEMGELAFGYFQRQGMLEQYKVLRAEPPYAIDGDYVDETRQKQGDSDAFREEFAESFGNYLRSRDGIEMLYRRLERVSDRQKFRDLLETDAGRQHINYLLHESLNLKAFFDGGILDVADPVKASAQARAAQVESIRDSDDLWESALPIDMPTAESMSPWRRVPKTARPKPKNFLSAIWSWLTE